MTQAKPRFRTIEDYLNYDDGTDARYELVNGELVELPSEDPINSTIAMALAFAFGAFGIPPYRFAIGHQIEVDSVDVTARQPDLIVHTDESIQAVLSGERILRFGMPAPMLVVEVVSPGTENRDRDYIEKRQEYALRGIPEYWLIDPSREVVAVLSLENGAYRSREFRGIDAIASPTFLELKLTAEQVLSAGR